MHIAWESRCHGKAQSLSLHCNMSGDASSQCFDAARGKTAPRRAQACPQPAETDVMPSSPATLCGCRACTQPRPSPSCPRLELPHAQTVPSVSTAKETTPEAAMLFTCSKTCVSHLSYLVPATWCDQELAWKWLQNHCLDVIKLLSLDCAVSMQTRMKQHCKCYGRHSP